MPGVVTVTFKTTLSDEDAIRSLVVQAGNEARSYFGNAFNEVTFVSFEPEPEPKTVTYTLTAEEQRIVDATIARFRNPQDAPTAA